MRFILVDPVRAERVLVSIDGIAPRGPNFSHRVGNRTPDDYRADTAAGVIDRLLDDGAARDRLVADYGTLAATQYTPAAVLAVHLFLDGHAAVEDRDLILEAATAADYGCLNTEDAVRVALTLQSWAEQPPRELRTALRSVHQPLAREQICFEYALRHLPHLLAEPAIQPECWRRSLAMTQAWLEAYRRKRHSLVLRDVDLDLVHLVCDGPIDRRALRTVTWESRTLVSQRMAVGWDHVFSYEVESHFDVESSDPPDRHRVGALAARLAELDQAGWRADTDLSRPLVHLVSGPRPSTLEPEQVGSELVTFLEKADGLDIPRARARRRAASTPFREMQRNP